MKKDGLVQEAYARALDVLRACSTEHGFKASALAGGYPQVWARDSSITALGALLTGEPDLVQAARASLETLARTQTPLGMIHLNLDTRTNEVTTENAGAVDANLWFILGHYAYFRTTADQAFLSRHWPALERAALWLRYQDMNACGLLEVPEAGDWADLYSVRYNVLYDNVLYVGAMTAMAQLADGLSVADPAVGSAVGSATGSVGAEVESAAARAHPARAEGQSGAAEYAAIAGDVRQKINLLMWLDRPWDGLVFGEQLERLKALRLEWFLLYQNTATLTEAPYYLPWAGFREFGHTFDGLGNILAILLGVADEDRRGRILTHAHASGADAPFPLKAFSPSIYPGDRDWRDYYRSRNLNLPDQYHNGGIWPFIGGFYVAALVKAGLLERAEEQLILLAESNRAGKRGEWEFNEWLHGVSGRPMGHPLQAWSAAMLVYAVHAVERGGTPFWSELAR